LNLPEDKKGGPQRKKSDKRGVLFRRSTAFGINMAGRGPGGWS